MNNRVKLLMEDLTFSSHYELLEEGKNDKELTEIAEKKGLKIPSRDLAIFKCKYAMVDQENRNHCTLPRKEVKKAIESLTAKAIDKDHFRKSTIGHWLDAKIDGEDIIAYGCFWKSNFPEDYEEIKRRLSEGKLKISFEAWGDRQFKENGSYELTNIEFAGGALLFDTQPAFPDAEVMEFSKYQNQVLEFAKVIEDIEEAKLDFNYDINNIARIMLDTECPNCKMKGWHDIQSIDFENSKIKHKCGSCGSGCETDMTPKTVIKKRGLKVKNMPKGSSDEIEDKEELAMIDELEGKEFIDEDGNKIEDAKKLTYKERKQINDDMFAVVVNKDNKKIRMFPIQDPAHVRNALARLPQATNTLSKLGISPETVKRKILKRAKELNMTDLLKRHAKGGAEVEELLKKYNKASVEELIKFVDETLASLSTKEQEFATLKKEVEDLKLSSENAKLELEKVKGEYATVKADLDSRVTAEKAAIVKARKDELGEEIIKELNLSDDDIIHDLKFENAKLKKALKAQPSKGGLEAGAEIKVKEETIFNAQSSIHERAFSKD